MNPQPCDISILDSTPACSIAASLSTISGLVVIVDPFRRHIIIIIVVSVVVVDVIIPNSPG